MTSPIEQDKYPCRSPVITAGLAGYEQLAAPSSSPLDGVSDFWRRLSDRRRHLWRRHGPRDGGTDTRLQGHITGHAAAARVIFGLFVAFLAAQVWSDFDQAHTAVNKEASALRDVVLLASSFPGEPERLRTLVRRHIHEAVTQEWPAMAQQRATLARIPGPLAEALRLTLDLTPQGNGQVNAQRNIAEALQNALDSRRHRIIVSGSTINGVKWAGLLTQAICMLFAIAMVHCDNRVTAAISLALFATAVAVCVLLIASHDRPFTGEISAGPGVLLQVMPEELKPTPGP